MKKKRKIVPIIIVALLILSVNYSAAREEGGYVYSHGEDRFVDNVYNFLKHFSSPFDPNQYYWDQAYMFTTHNDSYIDEMDIAYYSGHGNHWYLAMGPGASDPKWVNIKNPIKNGWGNKDLEFIVFQSCAVIPAPPDVGSPAWAKYWAGPGRVFQGLHQAIGYRTSSYSGNGISSNFGWRIRHHQRVWQAWFAAVNDERSWWHGEDYPGYASVVLYPGLDNDTYYDYGDDPPKNHTKLRIYWQY